MKRTAHLLAALLILSGIAPAGYHFLHYAGTKAPFVPIPERFDLNALPNKTVRFYVAADGPQVLAANDSFPAILSQLRRAGEAWNAVPTSDLRVAYGGLFNPGVAHAQPRIEVTFEELPPGLLAQGGPVTRADVGADATFVPILKSVVWLNKDLSGNQASYNMDSFLTLAHELGHALGLQHTLTSGLMSTAVTRATTEVRPIAPDDVAAISALYPAPGFASEFGTLSGRVTMGGNGVHLASIVALTPTGPAVSALSHPDGTYRLEGLRSADYYVYVHPLPPGVQADLGPSEIVLPTAKDGTVFQASGPFRTQFYPGTRDLEHLRTVRVTSGAETDGIDFEVEPRSGYALHSITTYGYPDVQSRGINAAMVNAGNPVRPLLVAVGAGLIQDGRISPGLRVDLLGGGTTVSGIRAWDPHLIVDLRFSPVSGTGPRHLVFSTPDDVFVLPSGLTQTWQDPPLIESMEAATEPDNTPVLWIAGKSVDGNTRILFDGVDGRVLRVDQEPARLVVAPPPGAPGHIAHVAAFNPDGTSSDFRQWPPPTYTYPAGETGSVALSSYTMPAGTEGMLEITGVNAAFAAGHVHAGFGASDLAVRSLWVVSPDLVRVNVAAFPRTEPLLANATVMSGFRLLPSTVAFEVRPATNAPTLRSDVLTVETNEPGAFPGAIARIPAANLGTDPSGLTLTLNDVTARIVELTADHLVFEVPGGLPPGPVVIRLRRGDADAAAPVFVVLNQAPPVVTGVVLGEGDAVAASFQAGQELAVFGARLIGAEGEIETGRLAVEIGGVSHPAKAKAQAVPERNNEYRVLVDLSAAVAAGERVPVRLVFDGRKSAPFYVTVAEAEKSTE